MSMDLNQDLIRYPSKEPEYPEEKKEQIRQDVQKLIQAGGLFQTVSVNTPEYSLRLLRNPVCPVTSACIQECDEEDQNWNFNYSWYEQKKWDQASFDPESCILRTGSIGYDQFEQAAAGISVYLDMRTDEDRMSCRFYDDYCKLYNCFFETGWICRVLNRQRGILHCNLWNIFQKEQFDSSEETSIPEIDLMSAQNQNQFLQIVALTAAECGLDAAIEQIETQGLEYSWIMKRSDILSLTKDLQTFQQMCEAYLASSNAAEKLLTILSLAGGKRNENAVQVLESDDTKAREIYELAKTMNSRYHLLPILVEIVCEEINCDFWPLWKSLSSVWTKSGESWKWPASQDGLDVFANRSLPEHFSVSDLRCLISWQPEDDLPEQTMECLNRLKEQSDEYKKMSGWKEYDLYCLEDLNLMVSILNQLEILMPETLYTDFRSSCGTAEMEICYRALMISTIVLFRQHMALKEAKKDGAKKTVRKLESKKRTSKEKLLGLLGILSNRPLRMKYLGF